MKRDIYGEMCRLSTAYYAGSGMNERYPEESGDLDGNHCVNSFVSNLCSPFKSQKTVADSVRPIVPGWSHDHDHTEHRYARLCITDQGT